MKAGEQFAVDDNTAAYAGPQRDRHRVGSALGRAGQHLSQRSSVGIVGDIYFLIQLFLQICPHGNILKQQVVGIFHHAGFLIGRSGYANANPPNLFPRYSGVCRRRFGTLGHGIHHFLGGARNPGFCLCPAYDVERIVHNTSFDVGSSRSIPR